MTSTDHIATLTAMLELWAEGSLEHVALDITAASNSLKDKAITSSFGAGNRAKVRSSVTPRYTGGAA